MAFVNEHLEGDDRQTIDRQRNIVLKRTGSFFPDNTPSFSLNVDGNPIAFDACQGIETMTNKKMRVIWDVRRLYLSSLFERNPAKARELITEALDAYGFSASRELVDHVEVKFSLSL